QADSKPSGEDKAAADKARAEEAGRLARALEDPEKRQALIRQLDLLAAAGRAADPPEAARPPAISDALVGNVGVIVDAIVRALVDAGALVADLPRIADWLYDQVDDGPTRARWLGAFGEMAIVLGIGFAVQLALRLVLAPARGALARRTATRPLARVPLVLVHALVKLAPVLGFAAGAYATLALLPPDFLARFVCQTLIQAILIAGIVQAIARAILAPDAPGLRLAPVSDETAHYLLIWVGRFVAVTVYADAAIDIALLIGLPVSIHALLARILGLLVAGLAVVFILQNRDAVSDWLRRRRDDRDTPQAFTAARGWLADTWHVLALVYVAVLAAVWLFRLPGGFAFVMRASAISIVILAAAVLAQRAIRQGVRRMFSVDATVARDFPAIEARANRYMAVVNVVASAAVGAVALVLLLQAWGADSIGWLSSDLGRRITGGALSIVVVLLLALFVWEVVDRLIERSLLRLTRADPTSGHAMRLRTFLPLLRNVAMVVLATVVVFVLLAELGVNIAPLIAGASIIGLAVAFGANALVKDVITGLFILIEGTISIGDIVEVDGRAGVVEGLSIRTLRLRDLTGAQHTIPFSNVTSVKNMTKDFSYYVVDAGVSYDSDLIKVMDVLRAVDADMRADPAFAAMISAPIEILGVDRFADSSIIVRARLRTPPAKQWSVGREFNRRMKEAFDREGIVIPYPHQVVVGERPLPIELASPPAAERS
ncbi:MAG: mechanosensitive ion channel domain-containing protein, partial [Alphaproteobacteria bacterium]